MLEGRDISFTHDRAPVLRAVSLTLSPGEIVGLDGPSGVGKSTLARILAGHLPLQSGTIGIDGAPPARAGFNPVQYIAQTPTFAVDPRWKIGKILHEAWTPDGTARQALQINLGWYDRYPHELSGGQLQRVAILRALAPGLRYLIADEISAMLDAITQAQLWHTLKALAAARSIGILAISHDRALLTRVANRTLTLT